MSIDYTDYIKITHSNSGQNLLAIIEELKEFPRRFQRLFASLHQLQKIRPDFTDHVFIFGNSWRLTVAGLYQLIADLGNRLDSFFANAFRLIGKFIETISQHL